MQKKHLLIFFSVAVGIAGAASVGHWPNHAKVLEIGLYSILVLGSLLFGFWSDIHRIRFWTGMVLAFLLHGFLLSIICSAFPFRTILTVIPILLLEGIGLAIMMIKLLGDEKT